MKNSLQNTWVAVVVAQLTARSLPIPEDPGSNPILCLIIFTFNCMQKDEDKFKKIILREK